MLGDKCYKSIEEMPAYNWFQIHKTGNLKYLLEKGKKSKSVLLIGRWKRLCEQYIERFGFGENYIEVINQEMKIGKLIIQKAETERNSLNAIIEIEKLKLEEIKGRGMSKEQSDFFDIKSQVERILKMQIDLHKTSVVEFFSYLKMIKNDSKVLEQNNS